MNGTGHHERETCVGTARYALELPITFEHGAGVTLAVSREEVHFTTLAAVAVGQHLTGKLRFPAEASATCTVLRYVARVTGVVEQPCGSGGRFAVSARFDELDFVPCGLA
jgi:hypothetical protein